MPARHATPDLPLQLGDAASALDIVVNLLLDVIAVQAPGVGAAVVIELDKLLVTRLPTPGLHARLEAMREHVSQLVAASGGSGLPN